MFAVIDCNNFFVSCEKVFNPILEGKAVVVLSNNDGCVVSRSAEAKKIGIKMGMPAYKIKEEMGLEIITVKGLSGREKWNGVVACSSNYNLYGDMSRRVISVIHNIVGEVEIYSIDEVFVELKGMDIVDIKRLAEEIVYKVKKFTGIPVCVGVGETKTLAKVANRFAKMYKGYNGCCVINTESQRVKALKLIDIGDIWGIGKRYAKFLKGEGVMNGYDFATKSAWWVKKNMGVVGLRTQMELNGKVAIMLDLREEKKSIATSRSFGEMVKDYEDLESAVSCFAASCAEKLRKQCSVADCVTVYVLTNFYREDLEKYYNSATFKLEEATDNTIEIVEAAVTGLKKIYRKGYFYKKAGVIVSDICANNSVQQNLFIQKDVKKINRLNKVLDDVNLKYGRDTLKVAVQGGFYGKDGEKVKEKWVMKREGLSGNFTTDLNDVIIVKS